MFFATNLLLGTKPVESVTPSVPSIEAAMLAEQVAPNAQVWRQQAQEYKTQLSTTQKENALLRAEIEQLKQAQNEWQAFTATAYTADCAEGCTGITATGLDVRNTEYHNGLRVIATDPAVIPLGTTVEIRFSDGTLERAIASDTGGAINGNIIDYLVADYNTAIQFGRQTIEIRKLEEE